MPIPSKSSVLLDLDSSSNRPSSICLFLPLVSSPVTSPWTWLSGSPISCCQLQSYNIMSYIVWCEASFILSSVAILLFCAVSRWLFLLTSRLFCAISSHPVQISNSKPLMCSRSQCPSTLCWMLFPSYVSTNFLVVFMLFLKVPLAWTYHSSRFYAMNFCTCWNSIIWHKQGPNWYAVVNVVAGSSQYVCPQLLWHSHVGYSLLFHWPSPGSGTTVWTLT